MSRKTVVFKIPPTDSPRRDDAPSDAAAPIDELSPSVSSLEPVATEITSASEPDRWVRNRDLDPVLDLAPVAFAPPLLTSAANWSVTFDLAAERSFSQVVALSFAAPSVLGWFWFANAMNRYRRIFTG